MKWLLIIVATIVCLIAFIYLIGLTLPVKHTISIRTVISANTLQVWNRITDVSEFAFWRKNLNNVRIINEAEWVEVSGDDRVPMKVKETIPMKKWVVVINSRELPFGGEWVYELQSQGNNTELTITENGEVYNPIFRFVSKFIMGHEATLKKYMSDLKNSFK